MLSARPEGLPPAGLADLLRRAARLDAQTAAFRAGVIAEAERIDAARKEGFSSTTAWLAALSGEPVPICRSQIAVAEALEGMPATREAFAAGEVSESRVKVLAQAQALCPDQFAQDEAALVAQVAAAPARQVPKVLAAWKKNTDPQAAEAEVEQLRGLRALHLSPGWLGMVHLSGDLDPESGLTVTTALRSLAEPPALDPADPRTPAQRWADALVEICRRYLDGNPGWGSSRPHVGITVPWDTLQQGHGIIDTAVGPIPAETARRLACDATISGIILDKTGCPCPPARPDAVSPHPYAEPWTCGTGTAPTPAATSPPTGATPTTSSTGPKAAKPRSRTCGSYAEPTTAPPTTTSPTPNASRSPGDEGWSYPPTSTPSSCRS